MSDTVQRFLPTVATLNFISTTTSRPGCRTLAHLAVRPALPPGCMKQSHHASGTSAPGKSGACTAPAASPLRRFARVNVTCRVARSPWQMLSSPSTKTFASVMATCGAVAANSSTSMSCCWLKPRLLRPALRSSVGSSKKAGRPADFRGPLRQSLMRSVVKCGTCSKGPVPPEPSALGSSACTIHRCNSSAASSGSAWPSLAATSAIAKATMRQLPSNTSRSSARAGLSSSRRRCVCARSKASAFWGATLELAFLEAALPPPLPWSWASRTARA
mmetsp:Transcript_118081/g.329166  ORF Transcript_118081/g.329166 Transcript_118081/m.329166 type:complete len:274 (+) Transcript_118081:233-1054(+)